MTVGELLDNLVKADIDEPLKVKLKKRWKNDRQTELSEYDFLDSFLDVLREEILNSKDGDIKYKYPENISRDLDDFQRICVYKMFAKKAQMDCDVSLFAIGIYRELYNRNDWHIALQPDNKSKEYKFQLEHNDVPYVLRGDTMNSFQTTWGHYLRTIWVKGKGNIEKLKNNQIVGTNGKFVDVYKNNGGWNRAVYLYPDSIFSDVIQNNIIRNFIKVNHTIGNFIPVPFRGKGKEKGEFNRPRKDKVKDYWDLTLFYIYSWYKYIEKEKRTKGDVLDGNADKCDCLQNRDLCKLLGNDCGNVKLCVEWLCEFCETKGTEKIPSWNAFVTANYMQPFVYFKEWADFFNDKGEIVEENFKNEKYEEFFNRMKEIEYGRPIELWGGHFGQTNALPQNEEDCKQFFDTATICIQLRTQIMVAALEDKLKKEKDRNDIQ